MADSDSADSAVHGGDELVARMRQELATSQYFGVDFVPKNGGSKRTTTYQASDRASKPTEVAVIEATTTTPDSVGDTRVQKQAELDALKARYEEFCPEGTIATPHTQVVFGEGNPDPDLLFIGEAPGAEEDKTGRPFVGRAGQKLNEIIGAMGLDRTDVYITNVVKIRPPENRTPMQSEIDASSAYLAMQIAILQPRVIVTLGSPATKLVLQTKVGISKLRGVWAEYADADQGLSVPVMPTFHPAYLLRAYTPENRRLVWSDMQQVMERLG